MFFWCVWHSSKSVKNFFFLHFGGFCGVAYSCWFGFGRFRCFGVSCFCFAFLCWLGFCFVCVVLFCCWIGFGVFVFVVFLILFFCFCFCFFGGFKGQVRWPEGPPHLALNPPYLVLFFFLFCCFCFLFVVCLFFVCFLFV